MTLKRADIDEALAAAIEVFWRHGYEKTKVEDIVAATGLNRYALYAAFGGKRELFLEALRTYKEKVGAIFHDGLEDPTLAPLSALRRVAAWTITQMASRKAGCLLCNVAAQESSEDDVIAARVQEYMREIEGGILVAMERARERGELADWISPEQAARHMMNVKLGCGAQAATGARPEDMLESLDVTLTLISGGKYRHDSAGETRDARSAPFQSSDPVHRPGAEKRDSRTSTIKAFTFE